MAEHELLKSLPNTINYIQAVYKHFNGEVIFALCETWLNGNLWMLATLILSVTLVVRITVNSAASLKGSNDSLVNLMIQAAAIMVLMTSYKLFMGLLADGFRVLQEAFPMGDVSKLAAQLDAKIKEGWKEIPFWKSIGEDGILYYFARVVYETTTLFSIVFLLIFEVAHAMIYTELLIVGYILIPLSFATKDMGNIAGNWWRALLIVMLWPVIDVIMVKLLAGMFFSFINDPTIGIKGNGLPGLYFALMSFSVVNILICVVIFIAPILTSKFIAGNGDISSATRPFGFAALGIGAAAGMFAHKAMSQGRDFFGRLGARAAENATNYFRPENFGRSGFRPMGGGGGGGGFSPQGGGIGPGVSGVNGFVGDTKPESSPLSFNERPQWPTDAEIANPTPQSFENAAGVGLSAGSVPNINPSANSGSTGSGPSKSVGELLGSSPKKVMPDLGTGVGLSTSSGASAGGSIQPGTSNATPSQPTKSVGAMLGVKPVESPKPLSVGVGLSASSSKSSGAYTESVKPNTGVGRSLGIQPDVKPKPEFGYGVGLSSDSRPPSSTAPGESSATSEPFSINKAMGVGAKPAASQATSESSQANEAKPEQLGLSLEEKKKKDRRNAIIRNVVKTKSTETEN